MPVYEGKCEKCGKESDELLMFKGKELCWECITEGRKPVENLTAQELKDLIKLVHPYEKGEPYNRGEIITEIGQRGESLLKELGWPTDMTAMYRHSFRGDEETLYELINEYGSPEERARLRKEGLWHDLFLVIEDWEPAIGPNVIRAKYEERVRPTPENVEWGIEQALGHIEKDWIRRNVRELLQAGKRDEAIKFLSENIRNFGVAQQGRPYVQGSPKGVLIQSAIMDPKETKLITWAELLRHVEMEGAKTLEAYGVIPTVIPKIPPKPIVTPPVEEEVEEAEVEKPEEEEPEAPEEPPTPAIPPIVVPARVEVSYPWNSELYTKKEVPEELKDVPIFSSSYSKYEELEEFLKTGQTDEIDMVSEQLSMGGEAPDIAYTVHLLFGVDIPGEILKLSEKFREKGEITDEEYEKVREWANELPSFIFKWAQTDVKWTPEAEKARDVVRKKYGYDELVGFTRKDIDYIAKAKGLSTGGRMDDVAHRIHQFDYGEEEAKSKMAEIDKLLG